MFSRSSRLMINGGMFNNISQSKRGIDLLMDCVATDAFHNSDEMYDAPKCHPHTRVAVLDEIMKWVIESDSETQGDFMMWLFGPAGAGKSAIAKKIAELATENGLLIGSFFFSRTSSKRNTKDRLVATLAYQMALSVPGTRTHIEEAIETDPAIFYKDLQTQIDTLLMKPFQSASTQTIPFQKLIIIDGLDECSGSQAQIAILDVLSRAFITHKLPVICLVASRPETHIVTSFNGKEPLKSIHRRLALDHNYHPDDDIRRFLSDKFEEIRSTHRLRSTIPIPWPAEEALETLVKKSSGQFIFAATVVRFVESHRHRPAVRLNIILGISPAGTVNPFAELDVLYKQILSSVEDIQLTLHVLGFYAFYPDLVVLLGKHEQFLSLEEGDIDRALIDLSSLVSYGDFHDDVQIFHASLVDFLSDKHRSDEFYIDMASARTDVAFRTLQYVKAPNGIGAGDLYVFLAGIRLGGWILNDKLMKEILNFDLDAFVITATSKFYRESGHAILVTFIVWVNVITEAGLKDGDEQLLVHRWRNSFEMGVQRYQSGWGLLLTMASVMPDYSLKHYEVPMYDHLYTLLEMDDDDHLVDQNALALRRFTGYFRRYSAGELRHTVAHYIGGDRYASAALHCMRFISKAPKYSDTNGSSPQTGIIYAEWKATCGLALDLLCELLERANTSPEVIQFMRDHDINTTVQKTFPVLDIWRVDAHILAFLSRGGVCVNWRIISAIRRGRGLSLSATDSSAQSESSQETDSDMYESAEEGNVSDTTCMSDLIT